MFYLLSIDQVFDVYFLFFFLFLSLCLCLSGCNVSPSALCEMYPGDRMLEKLKKKMSRMPNLPRRNKHQSFVVLSFVFSSLLLSRSLSLSCIRFCPLFFFFDIMSCADGDQIIRLIHPFVLAFLFSSHLVPCTLCLG